MKEYEANVRVVFRGTVIVEAESEADAIEKLDDGKWELDGDCERVDWDVTSRVKEVK